LYVPDDYFVLFHKLSFERDMRGLNAVLLKKLGAGIPESACADRLGDVSRLAEVEAWGFHFAGLRLDVAPMRADHH
jgi:hypothetical protein